MQVLQRINCLRYMNPWIKNLELFANPTSPLFERSGARLRDCIRVLTDLSVNLPEVCVDDTLGWAGLVLTIKFQMATNGVQKYIWHEAGQLNGNIIDIIFDELIRSATDGGIGTHRCEIIAHSISAMSSSSIAIRGRLFSKLRKVRKISCFYEYTAHIQVYRLSSKLLPECPGFHPTIPVGQKFRP